MTIITTKYLRPVRNTPKYLQVVEHLKKYIGSLAPGEKILSEPLLCERFQVSRNTIRDAIAMLANEKLLERKQGMGTFVTPSRSKNIQFLIYCNPDPFAQFFLNEVYKGAQEEIANYPHQLVVDIVDRGIEDVSAYVQKLKEQNVLGTILSGVFEEEFIVELNRFVPVVLIGKILPDKKIDAVTPDASEGMRMALQHLFDLGHRKIAYLSSVLHHQGYVERLEAYQRLFPLFCKKYRSKEKPLFKIGDYSEISKELTGRAHPPTAVICCSDTASFEFTKVAKEKGLKIPEDISIIALDDNGEAEKTVPQTTTVNVDKRDIGRKAVIRLLEITNNKDLIAKRITVKNTLIIRSSTGILKY
jgi:DNA-binding LacI/PurR family transcriptional regulator